MSLADAQTLAIRKLLSKSAYDSTLSPGPPLPKSHPSPALLAKLYLECHALYSSAYALVSTVRKKDLKSGFNIGVAKLGKEKTGNTDNNATDEEREKGIQRIYICICVNCVTSLSNNRPSACLRIWCPSDTRTLMSYNRSWVYRHRRSR